MPKYNIGNVIVHPDGLDEVKIKDILYSKTTSKYYYIITDDKDNMFFTTEEDLIPFD